MPIDGIEPSPKDFQSSALPFKLYELLFVDNIGLEPITYSL